MNVLYPTAGVCEYALSPPRSASTTRRSSAGLGVSEAELKELLDKRVL